MKAMGRCAPRVKQCNDCLPHSEEVQRQTACLSRTDLLQACQRSMFVTYTYLHVIPDLLSVQRKTYVLVDAPSLLRRFAI